MRSRSIPATRAGHGFSSPRRQNTQPVISRPRRGSWSQPRSARWTASAGAERATDAGAAARTRIGRRQRRAIASPSCRATTRGFGPRSRETYLQALVATVYAGRFSSADDKAEIARLATSGSRQMRSASHSQLLLHGLARRLSDGYIATAPPLKEALGVYRVQSQDLGWLGAATTWSPWTSGTTTHGSIFTAKQRELRRGSGTLSWLPFALDYLAEAYLQAGELSRATALLDEAERIDPGIRGAALPVLHLPSLVAAWRGDAATTTQLTSGMVRDATTRGEGAALTYADYAIAVLYNGDLTGKYDARERRRRPCGLRRRCRHLALGAGRTR